MVHKSIINFQIIALKWRNTSSDVINREIEPKTFVNFTTFSIGDYLIAKKLIKNVFKIYTYVI